MEYEVTDVPAATYAVIERTITPDAGSDVIPQLIEEVGAWAHGSGAVAGGPLTLSTLDSDQQLIVRTGWQIEPGVGAPDPIEVQDVPAGRAAVYVHVGPYAELPALYGRLWDALRADGHDPGSWPREHYESGPDEDPPRTRVVWPLASS